MSDEFDNDKQVYYDTERKMLYWIEWEYTGNNDIPHRHYIKWQEPDQATKLGWDD